MYRRERTTCGRLQLAAANINRESAESADMISSRQLKLQFVRVDLSLIVALQEDAVVGL